MSYRSRHTRSTYDYASLPDIKPGSTLYFHTLYEDQKVNEMALEKMKDILSAYPNIGIPREPTTLRGNVLLGNSANAENLRLIKDLKINYLLNCGGGGVPSIQKAKRFYGKDSGIVGYKELGLVDNEFCDIKSYFASAHDYVEHVRASGGTVLIYCDGVSRSGAITLSYLVKMGVPLLEACRLLKENRRCVLTNESFMKQVLQYARGRDMVEWDIHNVPTSSYGRIKDRYRIRSAHLPLSVLDTGPMRTYRQENRAARMFFRTRWI